MALLGVDESMSRLLELKVLFPIGELICVSLVFVCEGTTRAVSFFVEVSDFKAPIRSSFFKGVLKFLSVDPPASLTDISTWSGCVSLFSAVGLLFVGVDPGRGRYSLLYSIVAGDSFEIGDNPEKDGKSSGLPSFADTGLRV